LRGLAAARRRFGNRRLLIRPRREGFAVNHKCLFRLYREERLTVRKRGGRKHALGTRAPLGLPVQPNERWSLDFASDVLTDGHRFRVLVVMDDWRFDYPVVCRAPQFGSGRCRSRTDRSSMGR
jgi:putative transposase